MREEEEEEEEEGCVSTSHWGGLRVVKAGQCYKEPMLLKSVGIS